METSQKDLCAKNTTPKEPQGGSKAIVHENADLSLSKQDLFSVYTNDTEMTRDHHRIFNSTTFVLSQNRWHCNARLCPITVVLFDDQLKKKIPSDPAFYQNNNQPKEIYSTRLGVKYEVMIKKYNGFRGKKNPYLKSVMEPTTTYSKTGVRAERLYYKEYKNLEFDIIRSHQQITRWSHLTKSIFKHERHGGFTKPYILGGLMCCINKPYGITQDPETNNYMIVFNDICEKCSKVCNSIHFQRNFESWTSGNVILYSPVMVVLRMRLYTTSAVFADLPIKGFVGTK
ncbi:hypothetical protein RhiirA5_427080 [Rhizophagus irregularis]|uniref:Uncharacterized protein n=1 Tax=Rhizophagus irregularis TaxID=588596 RepID=A0A2N0P318_9GLOM|nr:hypothetical protein RhiirA5_427080 [Rhizophagus irregularis]